MAGGQEGHAGFTHGPDTLTLLNRDLANEMNTMLMYMADSLLVSGQGSLDVKSMTDKFAKEDFGHAQKLAVRIVELEGLPEITPLNLQNNASIDMQIPSDKAVFPILKDALENEMQSVLEYRNQIQVIGFADPATRLLLEEILSDKEHQAEEIRHCIGL